MQLPFFYISEYDGVKQHAMLDEDTSRHVVQVLRMRVGEQLHLTDGKGHLLTAEITDEHKKHCTVAIREKVYKERMGRRVAIAISLLKNTNRFEWFLEKATEIGVAEIIPLLCERTEKEKFRHDRLNGILISAMLQSQQVWLPLLPEPKEFTNLKAWQRQNAVNYIAHCVEGNKQALSQMVNPSTSDCLICIGPEGDFNAQEIELAINNGFIPVSMGDTRLRTETAGVVAAALLVQL